MAHYKAPPKPKLTPALGVKPAIRAKSQARRQQLAKLAQIEAHHPAPRNDLIPKLNIVYVPIARIAEAKRRVRIKDAVQIQKVAASIAKFGVVVPLIVDQAWHIVHGHTVYEAARTLGLSELPVVILDHLQPHELRLLSIALNRLAETGTWDEEVLRVEVEELIELGEDLVVSGFALAEIDCLLLDDESEAAPEPEIKPPLLSTAISQPGDLWRLGEHYLFQGDARASESYGAIMQTGERARIVLTDTPYNVPNAGHVTTLPQHREFAMAAGEMSRDAFAEFLKAWLVASSAHVMDGGLVATFIDWRSVELVLCCGRELGFNLLNLVVWGKANAGQGSFWRSQHELLPIFKKGNAAHLNNIELGRHGRWRSNLWAYPGASTLGSEARDGLTFHPTVKPRAMLEDALLDVSQRGEIVIDPFCGSGSTLLAAETTGRLCRAIEIDGLYCDLTLRRWQELTGQEALLVATGESFGSIAQRNSGDGGAHG